MVTGGLTRDREPYFAVVQIDVEQRDLPAEQLCAATFKRNLLRKQKKTFFV